VVLLCNVALLVPLVRSGDRVMAALVAAQVLVLALAASGVVA
jgi:hypothetical protein